MKKILTVFLIFCSILSLFPVAGCSANNTSGSNNTVIVLQIDNPLMTVNGIEKEIDPGRATVPVVINDRTLVPIRAIMEAMGGTVSWDEETQTAALIYKGDEIRLMIDTKTAYFNDESYLLDTAPVKINDRTMLPVRFIAERFGFGVNWNGADASVTIAKDAQNALNNTDQPVISAEADKETDLSGTRAIVVYFSATGNTKSLAETVAKTADADMAEIVPREPYTSDDLDYNKNSCRANQEIHSDARPAIEQMAADIALYDVILLGYPIWWGECPPAVRTFLGSYDLSGKTILPFCTSGSTGISGSLAKIRELAPDSKVMAGFRGTAATTVSQIEAWLRDNQFSKPDVNDDRYMKLLTPSGEIIIALNNSNAATNLINMLPLELNFSDFNNAEKIAYPPKDIDVSDTAAGTQPKAGDLAIYVPWGNLALFYRDGSDSSSLVPLGSIVSGQEWIGELAGTVRAEACDREL